ncbi:MAG: class I SAM-dependent methyltransferase [Vicinamibacteria bacterium]
MALDVRETRMNQTSYGFCLFPSQPVMGVSRPVLAKLRRLASRCLDERRRYVARNERRAIEKILSSPGQPRNYDSEVVFRQLQAAYSSRNNYRYDSYSTWRRGAERAEDILHNNVELREIGRNVLEVGCGDGMTGLALSGYGHCVTLLDAEDWRDDRVKRLPFAKADLCGRLPFNSESFDLVYSFNTLEHASDPAAALGELRRVCKKGGLVFSDFGPLYWSPWGLHAYRSLHMPYPQYLFSDSFIENKLAELGIFDLGKKRTELQPLNKWRVHEFRRLWGDSGYDVITLMESKEREHLGVIKAFSRAFSGRGLTFDDVATKNIRVVLRRV